MPARTLIPDVISGQHLTCLPPTATVRDAVLIMAERRISAVLVTADERLSGIFTERDLAVKVVAAGLDAGTTPLSAVMTAGPDTLPPDATAQQALDLMESRRYRHLPVVAADGTVAGIVSIRDLFAIVRAHLEDEIKDREAFMFGTHYSVTSPTA